MVEALLVFSITLFNCSVILLEFTDLVKTLSNAFCKSADLAVILFSNLSIS